MKYVVPIEIEFEADNEDEAAFTAHNIADYIEATFKGVTVYLNSEYETVEK